MMMAAPHTTLFFNLLANSFFSLMAGLLVVGLFLWLFRIEVGPWRLFLLTLPFAKIVFDLLRGLPEDSVLRSQLDTFTLPPKHHFFMAGAGFGKWGPNFNLEFSVEDLAGHRYSESVGDYLVLWLNRRFGAVVPEAILFMTLAIAFGLLSLRLVQSFRFERARRADRRRAASLRRVSLLKRTVDIYVSDFFSGTPFTGGVLKPYICIPRDALQRLDAGELEAVIKHELGHIRQFDIFVTVVIQLLGDLFWFVPGYRWLSRKIDRLREIVADQWAVKSGAEPTLLASALLKLKDISTRDGFVLYSAFFREKSLLKVRIQRLLQEKVDERPRFGWQFNWVRIVVAVWIVTAAMTATFGGNHRADDQQNVEWIDHLLHKWGFEKS